MKLWIRRGLYPGIKVGAVYGTDGAGKIQIELLLFGGANVHLFLVSGTVVASGMPNDLWINKRVTLIPMRGWESDPRAPETQCVCIMQFCIDSCQTVVVVI
jgi:hypothetical protein